VASQPSRRFAAALPQSNPGRQDCRSTALEVLKSHCLPVFVTCLPAKPSTAEADRNIWNLIIGFEGFSQTVDYQLEKCSALLQAGQLKVVEQADYPVHQGIFGEFYQKLAQSSFILRGDFLLNRVAGFLEALADYLPISNVLLDFGCGRILAGFDELSDDQWDGLCKLAPENDGHVLLEKAPDDFRKRNDVFGRPNSAWNIMHRIKAELDPDNIFAPGRFFYAHGR